MKYAAVLAPLCALVFLTACRPSPEKLMATANKYHDNKKYREAAILYQKVLSKDKKNAEAYYRAGVNAMDEGSPSEAAQYFRRAVDLQPKNTDAAARLAEIYLTAYLSNPPKFKTVIPQIEDLKNKITQQDPNAFAGLRLSGILDILNGNTDASLVMFEKANKIRPYSRDLVGWYAEALSKNHPDQSEALVRDMLAHDKTWGPGYDYLFLFYRKNNNLPKAEAVLRLRAQNDPKSTVALINLSNYLLMTNRYGEAESAMKQVLNDKTAFPTGHMLLGEFYARAKKYDQALQQFQAGATEDPKQALSYNQRIAALYVAMGKRDEAMKLAQSLSEKNPKDATSNEMYAALLLQSGSPSDAKKALPELTRLVKNIPNNPILHLDLARANLAANDNVKSLSDATEAVQEEGKSHSPRPGVILAGRLISARIYEARGQHAQALEQSDQALKLQDTNAEARLLRDQALVGLRELDQAQPDLEKLVQQYPTLNEARLALGGLYLQQKELAKAGEQFTKVWNSSPPDVRGYLGIQEIKMVQGKTEDAVKSMQELVDKNPNVTQFRFQLANTQAVAASQVQRTKPAEAKAYLESSVDNYKQILKSNPNATDVWIRLGALQRALGQNDAALASFEQASNTAPQSVDALLNRATLLDALGRKKEAGDFYNRVLGVDPNNALALNNLAFLNADTGTNLDQAMTFAERAKKQDPKSPDVSDTLGYVYYRKNLNSEALEIFKQDVQDQPLNPTFHLHLAMALLKEGDKQGARTEAEKALKNAPPSQHQQIESFVSQIG
jgi:tetratricopeptide (TPR) repeat protein